MDSGENMKLNKLVKRKENGTVLVTLSVSHNSNVNSVIKQLRKEWSTACNIKSKHVRKKVQKALKLMIAKLNGVSDVGIKGFMLFGAFDGV